MIKSVSRLPYLDSARGLAAMSVITWHCYTAIFDHPEMTKLYTSPLHFFLYGEADMIFFFIHSGFILSYAHAYFTKSIEGAAYVKYIIARIFRIYPLFICILLLSFFLQRNLHSSAGSEFLSAHFKKFWNSTTSFSDLLHQGLLAVRIPADISDRLIPQDWTLTVEVLICPLIPFINYFTRKAKVISWIAVILLIEVLHANTYLFEFAIGVNIFYFRHQISDYWNKSTLLLRGIFLISAALLYSVFFHYPNIFNGLSFVFSPAIDRLMVGTGSAMFFIIILNARAVQRVISMPALVRVGKICYSLYVNHILVLICLTNIIMGTLHQWIKGPEWVIIVSFVLVIQTVNLLLSFITYNLIEKPFNKFGRQLTLRIPSSG